MPRRPEITLELRAVSGRRLVWKIFNDGLHPVLMIPIPYPLPATYKTVTVQPLILTPVTVREVERNLLLWARGRAGVMNHRRTTRPMRLLTRLLESGLEVIASHILTILGGPMERMADWGDKRRRPCIVSFTPTWKGTNGPVILTKGVIRRNYMKPERYKAILGSFENFSEILYCPRYYAY
jgi:hypothetical protein